MAEEKSPTIPETARDGPGAPGITEDMYKDFFDNCAIATVIIEEDGTISLVNKRFVELSGYSQSEVEGLMKWTVFVAPEDTDKLTTYNREILKPGGWVPPSCSICFVDRNNRTTAMSISGRRIPGTLRILVCLTDTSIQKRLEHLLRANEESYRVLVDNLSLGIYKSQMEHPGKFLWANPALIQMFGYDSLEELIKQPVSETYADPNDRDRCIEELIRSGYVEDFEVRLKKKDGSPFWVKISARPMKNREGKTEWVEGTVEDINTCRVAIQTCEQSNQYLNEILESVTTVGIFCTDESGTIILFNRGAEQMLGHTAAEVVGIQTAISFHVADEISACGQALERKEGQPVTGFEALVHRVKKTGFEQREWTYVRKDATRITVNLGVTRIRNAAGEDNGFLFTAKEITDRKRLEEAFRLSNLQMSGVIYNLPDATFAIDREGKVIAWNRAMEVITGVRAVDILGKGNYEYSLPFYGTRRPMLIDLITEPDSRIEDMGYLDIKRKGNAVTAEIPALDKSNLSRVLWSIAAPIFDSAGERAGAIESLADITERKMEETALQDSVAQFREILDNTGSATAIIEEGGTITYINPEFERVLGYVRDETEGKKKWMEFVVPEDARGMQDHWRQADVQEGPIRHEVRFIRWDGEVRNGYLTITRIPDTRKLVVALLDVTDKIKAETAVQLANRKINFLTGIIRHDILNQLTVLKGNLELAKEQAKDPGSLAGIAKELAAADAIQSLISFTRDYQDIGIEPPEWQDLRATILRSCAGIPVGKISLAVEIEGVEVYADRLLERVFHFLIANAVAHGKKISRIRLFYEESFEELHVVCEDDGVGIPAGEKENIFQRQFFTSTGLELYLAREILSITCISIRETGEPGNGARFEIHVPKGGYRFSTAQQ